MKRLILWVAQGMGSGRAPFAPGTFGSLTGVAFFVFLVATGQPLVYLLGTLAGVAASVWFCGEAEKILGQTDPGSVVLDEIIAMPISFGGWVLRLILAGIAVSAFFSAGLGVLKYLADPTSQLPEITFWLLGGLWSVTWRDLFYILPVVVIGLVIIYLMRWRLNLLSLGDETAASLGVSVKRERTLLLGVSVAITAVVVSVAGIVGWIGLIIPHIARRLVGANSANFIPVSIAIGGAFAILCDDIARTLSAGEIPLGIITSLLGAIIFLVLMISPGVRLKQ